MAFLKIKNKRFQELFKTEQEAITQRKAWEMEYEIYD
jgi:hypothetical protein